MIEGAGCSLPQLLRRRLAYFTRRHLTPHMVRSTNPQTLGEYVAQYGLFHACTPEGLRQYEIAVKLFERWAGGPVPLESLDAAQVSQWLVAYAASGVAGATVRSKRSAILALWRAAADDGLCSLPTRRVRPIRVPYKPPDAFTVDEAARLVNACAVLPRWHSCGLRRSDWWRLAILMAWDTGLRAGDLWRLRVDQISETGLVVLGQSKTGWGHTAKLSQTTQAELRRSLETAPRELVCPWDATRETFDRQFLLIRVKAGVRAGTWKWLRSGSASDVEARFPGHGARHLGHKPGSTVAAKHYFDPRIVQKTIYTPTELKLDAG